jgi:hypothetical protein
MTEIILYIILIQIIYFLWFHFVLSYKTDKQDKIKDSLNKFLMFMAPIYIIVIWNIYNMNLHHGKMCDYLPILNKLCNQ